MISIMIAPVTTPRCVIKINATSMYIVITRVQCRLLYPQVSNLFNEYFRLKWTINRYGVTKGKKRKRCRYGVPSEILSDLILSFCPPLSRQGQVSIHGETVAHQRLDSNIEFERLGIKTEKILLLEIDTLS